MFKLTIRTPQKEIYGGDVESVYVTTELGDMEILPGHAAFSGNIIFSPVIIRKNAHIIEDFLVQRGIIFFSNTKNEAYLLAQHIEKREEIDFTSVKEYLSFIEKKLNEGNDLSDFQYKFLENEKLALVKTLENSSSPSANSKSDPAAITARAGLSS